MELKSVTETFKKIVKVLERYIYFQDQSSYEIFGRRDVGSKTTCGRLIGYSRHEPGAF